MGFSLNVGRRRPLETRETMIAQTSAFLTWALAKDRALPRIPTRRVDLGGFSELMRRPAAKVMASHWWHRAMDMLPDD